jgi:aminoglycoside phosphotransferase (APT) family kinase protein
MPKMDAQPPRPRVSRDALAQLASLIAPGSRPASVRPLLGGIDALTDAFNLNLPDGERRQLVLRRYPSTELAFGSRRARRCWDTLVALDRLDVYAPRPVWLDADGALLALPGLVMTRLPGRGNLRPRNLQSWLRQLGQELAALHRTPIDRTDLAFLPGPGSILNPLPELLAAMPASFEPYSCGGRLGPAFAEWRGRIDHLAPVLCHGDYWAGNTLWVRGRLSGTVDWDEARVEEPGADVGYCRMDLAVQFGQEAAGIFLSEYETAAGQRIPQPFFWDLAALIRSIPYAPAWVQGLHELGRPDITVEALAERLDEFGLAALAAASAAS